ncbi:MAG TPA: glycosyltransferase [Mycobacteriales bacterium]|jgi:glycosyltransferase involved in cell wall biosynthesis|nr:glycosyltransferase [Mycobacteriales bacterium]
MSIRVLHITHGRTTGLAHCVADWVHEQIAVGMQVTVACPPGRLADLVGEAGAEVVVWRAARAPGIGMLREVRDLRRIVTKVSPDLIHLHCAKAGLLGRLVIRKHIPTLFSPHAWSFLAVTGVMRRLVREWERFATRWTTTVVCVSQGEAATGRKSGIRCQFEVLSNQVNLPELNTLTTRDRGGVRAELGVAPGTPIAVLAARLCRQKGQDIAVAAWPKVREVVASAELVMLGDGPDREMLAERAVDPAASGVRMLGLVDRATTLRWMYAGDVVVCPSRWEGMSLVPLEAAALGRPVVISDVDGARESVPVQAGSLIPVGDSDAFAVAVTRLLSDPGWAMEMGEAARSAAADRQAAIGSISASRKLALLYLNIAENEGSEPA